MNRLIPLNIYRVTYRIRLGEMSTAFVGEMMFKSMQEWEEVDIEAIIKKNLIKWGTNAKLDDIIMCEKIGKE